MRATKTWLATVLLALSGPAVAVTPISANASPLARQSPAPNRIEAAYLPAGTYITQSGCWQAGRDAYDGVVIIGYTCIRDDSLPYPYTWRLWLLWSE